MPAASDSAAGAIPTVGANRALRAAAVLFVAIGLVWVTWRRPAWQSPYRVVPSIEGGIVAAVLAALALAQAVLHWLLPRFASTRLGLIAYFVAQTALAIGFGVVSRSDPWMYQLLLILLAEAVAVLPSPRMHAAAGLAQVAIAAGAAVVLLGPAALPRALMHSVPMAVSIVAFGAMFQRQARARHEAQVALAALDAAHGRLVEYAAEVERLTVAAERQRVARELHDTLAQGLVGLVLQLEALEAHVTRGDAAKAVAILRHARDRARAALSGARTAISDLRSSGTQSLPAAIREESDRFSAATGIPCALSVPPTLSLPEEAAGHAIRCVAEGLANVARHARATRASVSIAETGDGLMVELADDGIGFDVAAAEARPGHYGLLGLRERARLAGGHLEITSQPGAGTVLRLRLPHAIEGARA